MCTLLLGLLIGAAHASEDIFYINGGEDWPETAENAMTCRSGMEQSPIDLSTSTADYIFSEKMEINGYGYHHFFA